MNKTKLIGLFVAMVLLFAALGATLTGCVPREEQLLIYNWVDYMDDSFFKDFENQYKQDTGKSVKVKQITFDNNESMYNELVLGKKDYDLVVPSDYMLAKMIDEGELLEIDFEKIPNIENVDERFYDGTFNNAYDPDAKYTLPYLYGTLGILYDATKVNRSDMTTWGALWNETYKGKVTMKETARDCIAITNIYLHRTTLMGLSSNGTNYSLEYRAELERVFNDFSRPAVDAALDALRTQKTTMQIEYENDDGKDDLIVGTGGKALGLYWSCDAGFAMSENTDLEYYVPDEGSNLWFDAFAIPKNAVNVDAAHAFLNYICDPEIAALNMYYAGCTTPINDAHEMVLDMYEEDGFFDGVTSTWKQMFKNTIIVDEDTMNRCAVMEPFGDMEDYIKEQWRDIRYS